MESSKENLSKAERKALKAQRRSEKELIRNTDAPQEKVNILCVRFGNKYGIEYVERLRNMISRNITVDYEFHCLTDSNINLSGVNNIVQRNAGYPKGWWHKVHMFDPGLPLTGRILYFDLDVIVHNNIDKLTFYMNRDFIGIRDFNRKFHPSWKNLNSSVLAWNHGTISDIYTKFRENPGQAQRLHGDQDWIFRCARDRLKFWPDEWIQSYKWEIRRKEDLTLIQGKRRFREINNHVMPNPDCSVAVFHGDPNPADVQDRFVVDNWR